MKQILALTALACMLVFTACITGDTENPTVVINFPANGSTVNRGDIVIKAYATDNKSVIKVEFYVNGTLTGTDNVGGAGDTFRYTWSDTTGQVVGQNYSLVAKAYDKAENDASSATLSFTIAGGMGPTDHDDDIVGGDSIWHPSGNPHIVKRPLNIHDDGTLTVMPGCVVKFDTGAGLIIGTNGTAGELQAVGTADSMITFTSNASTPSPGDWGGFDFHDGTRSSTHLGYCDINYGGLDNYGAVSLNFGGQIGLDNCTIRNAPKHGIWGGNPAAYPANFTGNTITACGDYPVHLHPASISKLGPGNALTGNGVDGIYVRGGPVLETGTWRNHGVPYVLGSTVTIAGFPDANLTIERGSTIKLSSSADISVGRDAPGGLNADSVLFTSTSTTPRRGDWQAIYFYSDCTDAQCNLVNCTIEYGGGGNSGNVWINGALPTITGCYIGHSAAWGIYLSGSEYPDPATLRADNAFEDNVSGDIYEP